MKRYPVVPLQEVAEFIRGITFQPSDVVPLHTANSVACFRTKNVQRDLDIDDVWAIDRKFVKRKEQILCVGDILVSSANSFNLVGKCCFISELPWQSSFGGFVSVLRPRKESVAPKYLYYWFAADKTQRTVRNFGRQTTNIANLDIERCYKLSIPLPPLGEQHRIANILDKIKAMILKRQQSLQFADDLIKSRFVEMFGDPVTNPMGWEVKQLGDCGSFKNGINYSQRDSGYLIKCLGVGDFGNLYKIEDTYSISEINLSAEPSQDYLLQDGDIVFVRSNGNKELVGRSVEIFPAGNELTFSGFCIRYRNENNNLLTVYLNHTLHLPSTKSALLKGGGGRGVNIQNVNQQILSSLKIPLPPIKLQTRFAEFVQAADKLKLALRKSLNELEIMYKALVQCYFG